jgi:Fe-S-cluster containining protein
MKLTGVTASWAAHMVYIEAVTNQMIREARATQGLQVACDTCRDPACCEDAIYGTATEAATLAKSFRGAHKRRLRAWVAAHDHHTPRGNDIGDKRAQAVYRGRGIKCPWLEDGKCGIYVARPSACRTHVAIGQPGKCRSFQCGMVDGVKTLVAPAIVAHALEANPERLQDYKDMRPLWATVLEMM